ncbi:hypothetical protein Q1W70_22165 [Pseudomonas kielensis]|uniref:hypothetical protein n=1 Tax=Pseudomonas kielensis TaxID=2762577 RepID=UPI00265E6B70|nr:hypothetical protein [Pseudomonas kielensis]WKL52128.1 hypothetical protein Q1W70_22165 [Pseudomonas kielensis]
MNGFMIYELVDTKMRDSFDLNSVQKFILEAIAAVYSEATHIRVFDSFYSFKPPVLSDAERNRRVRSLGRMLARNMPALTRLAMRSYDSGKHARSNQLFKAVKGKKRLSYCLELLAK